MTDLNLIEQGLLACANDNKPFKVLGYQSSDGKVEDMAVTFGGYDGYLLLLQESLKFLEENTEAVLNWKLADDDTVITVIAELKDDLARRLRPKQEEENFSNEPFRRNDKGGISLMRLVKWESTIRVPGKASKSRDVKSEVKKLLNAKLPLNNFVYRIDLAEGKFENVTF